MIDLIGIGPGDTDQLTQQAAGALDEADRVIGYNRYLDLLGSTIDSSNRCPYPIGQEEQRARDTIKFSQQGEKVALISSGDAGIYGMGAALFEVLDQVGHTDVDLTVHPGVSAHSAASSLLGAPIGQDFATVSLSDLMTSWSVIRNRIEAATSGDFVIVIYNPRSENRRSQLPETLSIIRRRRSGDTPVGLVNQAYRSEQSTSITGLNSVPVEKVDMNTTLVVGNSLTRRIGQWMYTPRGYDASTDPTETHLQAQPAHG